MNHQAALILISILMSAQQSLALDNNHCNKTEIHEAINSIRAHIQNLRVPEVLTETVLDQIEASFKVFVEKYELFMLNCTDADKEDMQTVVDFFDNITNINQCIMSIVKGEMDEAKEHIEKVTDDQLMELMVTVYCANETDCRKMLNFANDLQNTYASRLIYESLTHLLENARMNTTLSFIKELYEARKKREDDMEVLKAIQHLLRQAIKADLTLEYDNIEALYKADSDLTYDVVQELIKDNFDGNIGSYAIFQLVQRSPNATLWIRSLEAILHKLQERHEVNSIFGAELVREIKRIEGKNYDLNDEDKEKLQGLKDAIPSFVEKLLLGEICCDMMIIHNLVPEPSNGTKVYISSKYDGDFKRVKFTPTINGSLVMLDVNMEGSFMTLVLDNFEHTGEVVWNNVSVPVRNAEMELLEMEEFCKIEKYNQLVCMPAQFILSTITKSPFGDSMLIDKFFAYYQDGRNTCGRFPNLV